MKIKFFYKLLLVILFISPIINLSAQEEAVWRTIGGVTVNGLTSGTIYSKAQVVALLGTPDRYLEWDSDGGKGFECMYNTNLLSFHPEMVFCAFVIKNNDMVIENFDVRIGDHYADLQAINNGSLTYHKQRNYYTFYPLRDVDEVIDVYVDDEGIIIKFVFSPSV